MSAAVEAYPLCWPVGRPRAKHRASASFKVTFAKARDELMREIGLLGGREIVLSTNVAIKRDGLPYAGMAQPQDTGVAVYFSLRGKQFAFACDRWYKVEHNVQAIRHTIGALRGIERWGTGDMVQAAFTGFAALPAPASRKSWQDVLGLPTSATLEDAEASYKRIRALAHPDRGGSAEEFDKVQTAIDQARTELLP